MSSPWPAVTAATAATGVERTGRAARRALRNNGLSIVLIVAFAALWAVQACCGWIVFNDEREAHHRARVTFVQYLQSGHFVEATAENWESEFLQMAAFVWLTVFLLQNGSPESRGVDGDEEQDRAPDPGRPGAPWPVRKGGMALALYSHSLTLAFVLLFLVSFILHAWGGARLHSAQHLEHGREAASTLAFMATADFWFESMQNWQSEFLAIGMMVILSVFLRQKGSPESKPVDAPHGSQA